MSDKNKFQFEGSAALGNHLATIENLSIPKDRYITFHMCHINHLDLLWYWQLPDTYEMCLDTIRWHVDLLEKHQDARYSHTQIYTLKTVEKLDPALFDRFCVLVSKGQIEIDSGQICEPDHNIPLGESQVRNLLYGQKYIQKHFGKKAKIVINSDSFGHYSNLPHVLKSFGLNFFIFKRPRQKYHNLPETPFWWQGLDGTKILSLRFINKGNGLPSLSQYYELPSGVSELQTKVNYNLSVGVDNFWGTHCESDAGGVTRYTPPANGDRWRLRYSLPSEFLESISSQLEKVPCYDGRLNYTYRGCYTTHIEEKQNCRRAEYELRICELLWSHASFLGSKYPSKELEFCWWDMAFEQFHDIICGTGSSEAHRNSAANYINLFNKLYMLRRKAQLKLESELPGGDIYVANTQPWNFCDLIELDVSTQVDRFNNENGSQLPDTGFLQDDSGRRLQYQLVEPRQFQRYQRAKMIFVSRKLCPLSISNFTFSDIPEKEDIQTEKYLKVNEKELENQYYHITFGGAGVLDSIYDKRNNKQCLLTNVPVRYEFWPETNFPGDYGTEMQAWFLGVTDDYHLPERTGGIDIIHRGPVKATICVKHRWNHSMIKTFVSLYEGCNFIDFHVEVDWNEKETLLRLAVLPFFEGSVNSHFGVPFGMETYKNDGEVPVIGWADISDDKFGLALLNRDRPGHCLTNGEIRVSIVRCATGDFDSCTDKGKINADFRIVPHIGNYATASIPAMADCFMHPPAAWQKSTGYFQRGSEIKKTLGIEVSKTNILLSCFKLSEDFQGYIVRLFESCGKTTVAEIGLSPDMSGYNCFETNLSEERTGALRIDAKGKIKLKFRGFEIKTLLFINSENNPVC